MGGPVEVAGDQLRAIVERIEHVEEEIRELNEAKREIFQEAKSNAITRSPSAGGFPHEAR